MKAVLTGTGTSQGIPVIGCQCEVCTSVDPLDRRLRSAAFLEIGENNLAIDAGPDFRLQMLSLGINRLDALLLTHEHNDHVAGLDDIRPFNFLQRKPLRVFALARVIRQVRERFRYIFSENVYPGAPQIEMVEIEPYQSLKIGKIELIPFLVIHGNMEVLAFRSGSLVYITDANAIPERSSKIIRDADIMVINALHHKRHHSHFNLEEAIEQARFHNARQAYFTHISHQLGKHSKVSGDLPPDVYLAYDFLTFHL